MQASARLSSSAASRKVIAGVSSATSRSWYRTFRGKAHAAPLPAQEPPPKGRKRLSKEEWRVRRVEFIENYRASNDGKFPSIENIRQQVGGGHYSVRVLLEEMMHKAKLPLDNPKPAEVTEHYMTKDDPGNQQREIGPNKFDLKNSDNPLNANDSDADQIGSDMVNQANMHSMTKDDLGNQQREIEPNNFDLKNSDSPTNANDSDASYQIGSDMVNQANMHAREVDPKAQESASTGLLGSLKSFAYGIRNFWKNM